MTENDHGEPGQSRKEWYEEAEQALEKAGAALRNAWEVSREGRASALETAKQAARQLGEAIDKGVEGARERWASQEAATGEEAEVAEGEE